MGLSAARAAAVRGVLRKRDGSQSSSPGEGTATPEAPRGKRRKTVAWRDGEELAHVVGCAESDVDRTPFDEPIRCGGCGLHCVGRMYACQLCARDDFALCAVCFAAHVRITAALAAPGAMPSDASRPTRTPSGCGPIDVPTSPDLVATDRAVPRPRRAPADEPRDSRATSTRYSSRCGGGGGGGGGRRADGRRRRR